MSLEQALVPPGWRWGCLSASWDNEINLLGTCGHIQEGAEHEF